MSSATTKDPDTMEQVKRLLTEVQKEADDTIKFHARLATAAGLVPITGLDIALVTAIHIRMVRELSKVYDVNFEEHLVKVGLTSVIGATIARLVSLGAREAFEAFSQFGKFADSLSNAAIVGFFTAAIGEIYSMHFEGGGNLSDLDVSDFIDYVSSQIRSGELHPQLFASIETGFSHLF